MQLQMELEFALGQDNIKGERGRERERRAQFKG